MPPAVFKMQTWMVEKAMPTASTGTTVPSSSLQRRGVMTIAPRVVMVVIITDSATCPYVRGGDREHKKKKKKLATKRGDSFWLCVSASVLASIESRAE